MISRILEAERTAQDLTRESRERQGRLEEDLKAETEDIRRERFQWADEKLAELRSETERDKAEKLKAQDEHVSRLLGGIEEAYRRYGDNWVDTLFHQIVGHPS